MKNYKAPSLVVYGTLTDMTLGILGTEPDVQGVNNINCLTGTAFNTDGAVVTIGCASSPLS